MAPRAIQNSLFWYRRRGRVRNRSTKPVKAEGLARSTQLEATPLRKKLETTPLRKQLGMKAEPPKQPAAICETVSLDGKHYSMHEIMLTRDHC